LKGKDDEVNLEDITYEEFKIINWTNFPNKDFGMPKIFALLISVLFNIDLYKKNKLDLINNYEKKSV